MAFGYWLFTYRSCAITYVVMPKSATDLPLKILVWEDRGGKVWISYNSPEYLKERHGLPQELLKNIAVVEALATKAAE